MHNSCAHENRHFLCLSALAPSGAFANIIRFKNSKGSSRLQKGLQESSQLLKDSPHAEHFRLILLVELDDRAFGGTYSNDSRI